MTQHVHLASSKLARHTDTVVFQTHRKDEGRRHDDLALSDRRLVTYVCVLDDPLYLSTPLRFVLLGGMSSVRMCPCTDALGVPLSYSSAYATLHIAGRSAGHVVHASGCRPNES
jgi:hypothetical protein